MHKFDARNLHASYAVSREPSLILAILSLLIGLILSQVVCGQETGIAIQTQSGSTGAVPSQEARLDEKLGSPEPFAHRPALKISDLGGEAGFGAGVAIGSGVAQLVIENRLSQPPKSSPKSSPKSALSPVARTLKVSPLQPTQPNQIPRKLTAIEQIGHQVASDKPAGSENTLAFFDGPFDDPQDPIQFGIRRQGELVPAEVVPEPLGYGVIYDPERPSNPWHSNSRPDEAVFNGGDQGKRVAVDTQWNVYNLNTEDTIGHFDTLDGRRLVTPSNRVAIYAPRFAAVRKVEGVIKSEARLKVGAMEEQKILNVSESQDFSTTTKQHLALERNQGIKRASGLRENYRGVTSDNVVQLFGARNTFEAFENLSLFRLGMHQKSEEARLGLAMQSANVWQDNLGLQVNVKGAQPVIVNDVYKVQQIVRIDSDDKQAILRVCKVASKISAQVGEPVDFTIRFDNLTGRPIGNVTIIDNLAGRLVYVPDSAECSLKANFSSERNEAGSLVLRWEIVDPMPANSGGIIRFRCRVQ